jgi:hypothetical protein
VGHTIQYSKVWLVGSNVPEDDQFLRAIKIHSTTSFRGEVKAAISCCKILRPVKDPYSTKETLVDKILGHFSPSFSCFTTSYLVVTARKLWWVNQK